MSQFNFDPRYHHYQRARMLIARSHVVDYTNTILYGPTGKQTLGRPSIVTAEAFWTVALLTQLHTNSLHIKDIHYMATKRLPRQAQRELGFLNPDGTQPAVSAFYGFLARLTHKLQACDDTVVHTLAQHLINASLPHMPLTGSYAIDATAHRVHSRSINQQSNDPDALWGHATDRSQHPSSDGRSLFFGFHWHLAVNIPTHNNRVPAPELIVGARLAAPTNHDDAAALALINTMRDTHPVHEVVADRAYTYKRGWLPGLDQINVASVADIHPQDHGANYDPESGALIIDGAPYSPHTPEHLHHIPRPGINANPDTHRAFYNLIAERNLYALAPINKGFTKDRYQCPSLAGKIACTRRPETDAYPPDIPRLTLTPINTATPLEKICNQATVTISHTALGKYRQHHQWGSPEWVRSFNRRSAVERVNGRLRDTQNGTLRRGTIRLTGLNKNTLMLAVLAAGYNITTATRWNHANNNQVAQQDPEYFGGSDQPSNYYLEPDPPLIIYDAA